MSEDFEERKQRFVMEMAGDRDFRELSQKWRNTAITKEYHYHFNWLGMPIIQFPQDILAAQEIVWSVKPDLIIETGVARGGSIIFYASLLQLIGGNGKVLGIDIDIRSHNREALESHPLYHRVELYEGSSVAGGTCEWVKEKCEGRNKVMLALDSNHTYAHVRKELELYHGLVSPGSYIIVFDTVIEDLPDEMNAARDWKKGNSPKTAVREFLSEHPEFEVDHEIEDKLGVTVCPDGFLRRIV